MSETTHYNVYKVFFRQRNGPDHEAIALVPAQLRDQDRGRFYHVKGDVGMGMDYECRKAYIFGSSQSYLRQEFVYQMERASLGEWEEICEREEPPHDPRVLEGGRASVDCSTWVNKVLHRAGHLAV